MDNQEPRAPIPWTMLIVTFLLSTILLISLCLAILDPARMELIQNFPFSPDPISVIHMAEPEVLGFLQHFL